MTVHVLTVCGSFHARSANRAALDVARDLLESRGGVQVRDSISVDRLPAVDPSRFDALPEDVATFRREVDEADGVIVAGPEYAGGVAGSLKNALDWCVGSAGLYRKGAVVMSAGTTGGAHAIAQLVRTLVWQGAYVVGTVGIAAPKPKSDPTGRLVDPETIRRIDQEVGSLLDALAMDEEGRALRTRELAAELGIADYPHRPG